MLAALWLAGRPRPIPDLRFSAPVVARPGTSIGVRAWQVDQDENGRTVIRAPAVRVELRNAAGLLLQTSSLETSRVQGAEGTLPIGASIEGELSLTARSILDGEAVEVSRTLYVQPGIDSKLPRGRSVNAFQAYELEPMQVYAPDQAPSTIDPRIVEGACSPELECTLLVWLDGADGMVRVEDLGGARFERSLAPVVGGFAELSLIVRGHEALVDVFALSPDGLPRASRRVRLPVVPGAMVARVTSRDGWASVRWQELGGPTPVLVDLFDGRRWVAALSLDADAEPFELPGPGIWRVQLRRDLFSDNTAAVSYAVLARSGGPSALREVAEAIARRSQLEGLDPIAHAVLENRFEGDEQLAIRALLSVPSFDVVSTGTGVSSAIVAHAEPDRRQDRLRWVAAGFIVLLGLLVSAVLFRVERTAQAEAARLLEGLDRSASPSRPPSVGRGLWAFVLFVFVLMALLALSKRWF